jgi:hypothetical protein
MSGNSIGVHFNAGAECNTVSLSTATGNTGYGMNSNASSSNTILSSYLEGATRGVNLEGESHHHTISLSTMIGSSYGLFATNSDSATVTESYLRGGRGANLGPFAEYHSISFSTMIGTGYTGLYTSDAYWNTVQDSYLWGINNGATFETDSYYNTISLSTMIGNSDYGLYSWSSDTNTVTQSYMRGGKTGAQLEDYSEFNSISFSTMVGVSLDGLYANASGTNTITESYLWGAQRGVSLDAGSNLNSVHGSTVIGASSEGFFVNVGSSNTIIESYVRGSSAAVVMGSTGTVFQESYFVATNAIGSAVAMTGDSVNLFVTSSTLEAPSSGRGVYLEDNNKGLVEIGSVTVTNAGRGLEIGAPGPNFELDIDSITFRSLTTGATAIHFLSGTYVSTITLANFEDSSNDVNVSAVGLNLLSRIFMRDYYGTAAGSGYENDPNGIVEWKDETFGIPETMYPGNGVSLSTDTPAFTWRMSTGSVFQLGPSPSYRLEVDDDSGFGSPAFVMSVAAGVHDASLRYDDGVYISTHSLATGGTYYWRVRAVVSDNVSGDWSSVSSFVIDRNAPSSIGFRSISSTGGFINEDQLNVLTAGTSAQVKLLVQDTVSGLALSTTTRISGRDGRFGGFHAMFTNDGGATWQDLQQNAVADMGSGINTINSMAVFKNKLYAGGGDLLGDADIWVCSPETAGDATSCNSGIGGGQDWMVSLDLGTLESVRSFQVFKGRLYAGMGLGNGNARIYVCNPGADEVCDPADWTLIFTDTRDEIPSLSVYNGKLYAGSGNDAAEGDVFVCDPELTGDPEECEQNDWIFSRDGAQNTILSLTASNGRLLAGQGTGAADGDVLDFNGTAWQTSLAGSQERIDSLIEFNGYVYAGQGGGVTDAEILVFDNGSWVSSYNPTTDRIYSMTVFNGRLFAGAGQSALDGDIYVCDPKLTGDPRICESGDWSEIFSDKQEVIAALATANGKLYAGRGRDAGDGDVFEFGPVAFSTTTDASSTQPISRPAAASGRVRRRTRSSISFRTKRGTFSSPGHGRSRRRCAARLPAPAAGCGRRPPPGIPARSLPTATR